MSLKTISKTIRYVAFAEGVSNIVLMCIAMPLKYFAHMPAATKYPGWVHGILFIVFMNLIVVGVLRLKWSFKRALWAFIASLIPGGTFILDVQLKKEEAALNG
ncbi:MAG: DUF3817 domain-containing protein [Cytophagales bacterium]|nr:DUF3817 domain-containing protein [Cytophaga sp.]